MGCNDYNLHLDSSEGNESPTPEFKIYLDGVGVNGYSPTIDIVNENTASFQIQTNDINGSELTSPIPKLSYLQSDYVSNTSLASTLANYSTTAEIANDYLKVDGSNADNPITINNIKIEPMTLSSINSSLYLQAGNGSIVLTPSNGQKVYYTPYNTSVSNKYEVAVRDDISNATITLTQGGVTKGTFTLNGSATTIDLDAGGGSITNPLEIEDTDSNNFISIGVDSSGANIRLGNTQGLAFNSYLIGNATAPLELTNGAFGDKIIKLNIDSTTLGVNSDNELYVVGGGGGTTYTAGTGIDITSNVISIDTDVVAQLSDIPDTTYMVTTNTAQTISGVKTFSSETHYTGVITFDSALGTPIIRGMSGASYRNMIYRTNSSSSITVGNSNDTIDLRGSGTRPTYNSNDLALYSDIPTNSTYVDLTSSQTITGKKAFSGAELETNNIITLKGNAIIRGLYNTNSYSTYLIGSNGSLLVGNESHGITLRGNAARPVYRTNGTDYNIALSGDIPSLATTSTAGIVQPDGSTITVNSGVIKANGVLNQQDNTTTLKYWTGTKAQYDAIVTKDSNTLYNVTDDTVNLNNVANTDLSNITDTGKIAIAHNAMPSNTFVNITFPANETILTAPANGFYNFVRRVGSNGDTDRYLIAESSYGGRFTSCSYESWHELCLWVPVKKNDTVHLVYSATGEVLASKFIYAQGSESEAS